MSPARIQLKRTRGWRMPAGAVYVGRPSVWGNRYTVGNPADGLGVVATAQEAVEGFRRMWSQPHQLAYIRERLRGKDLACWCALDQPCHAACCLRLPTHDPLRPLPPRDSRALRQPAFNARAVPGHGLRATPAITVRPRFTEPEATLLKGVVLLWLQGAEPPAELMSALDKLTEAMDEPVGMERIPAGFAALGPEED